MNAAVLSTGRDLLTKYLKKDPHGEEENEEDVDEVINLYRKRPRESIYRIPSKDIMSARVNAVLYAFVETDEKGAQASQGNDFFARIAPDRAEEVEDAVHKLLSRTSFGKRLPYKVSRKPKYVRLFHSRAQPSDPHQTHEVGRERFEFFEDILVHVDCGCLDDPDDTIAQYCQKSAKGATNAFERFHCILNELIGSRHVSALRGDMLLLFAALRANRLRTSELKPIHKTMPWVDVHSSVDERIRINSLFREFYPSKAVPCPGPSLPAAVHPSLSMGLSLFPLLHNCNKDSAMSQVGPYTKCIEVPEVKSCCPNLQKVLLCVLNVILFDLVEQVWAILMAMSFDREPRMLTTLRKLISKLAKDDFELEAIILQDLWLKHLATPVGANISMKLLEEVRKGANSNEKLQLRRVIDFVAANFRQSFQVEILTMTCTGEKFKLIKVPSDAELGNKNRLKVSIGHISAPTRRRLNGNVIVQRIVSSNFRSDRRILFAFAAANSHASYGSSRKFSWFAFDQNPIKPIVNASECTQLMSKKQVETSNAGKDISAQKPKDGDADEVEKRPTKRSRPS